MLDILLINCEYPDFKAGEMAKGNIGIKDGVIDYIGEGEPSAAEVIDVKGHVVSPGFIDIHMHEDDFKLEGLSYCVAEMMLKMGVTLAVGGNCGIQRQDIGMFKDGIKKLGGSPINYMMLAGYNQARYELGLGTFETATKDQWGALRDILHRELADGAIGVSFGIEYDPAITYEEIIYGINAGTEEGLMAAAHYRYGGAESLPHVQEMIDIQNDIPFPFQISHLSSCSAYKDMDQVLDLIHSAKEHNPLLDYDTYPYNAFSTFIGSEAFNMQAMHDMDMDYSDILLTEEPYLNMRCDEALYNEAREKTPRMLAVAFAMKEELIAKAVADPVCGMVASDAIIAAGNGHPRACGTFPRVLGKYVREDGCLSLYDGLRKITKEPADRLRMYKKGRIEEGCDADLTIFDKDLIKDTATYAEANLSPIGIDRVIVGGKTALVYDRAKDTTSPSGTACATPEIVNARLGRFIDFHEAGK